MYYNRCPECGANLDPGEPCDCKEERRWKEKEAAKMFVPSKDGQIVFRFAPVGEEKVI